MKTMYVYLTVVLELGFLVFASTALPLSSVKEKGGPKDAQKAYRLQVTADPKVPRCGVTDTEQFTTLGNTIFENKDLTYRFQNYTSDLPQNVVELAIKEALQLWADVTPLTFTQKTSPSDIEILFAAGAHGDSSPFDGPNNVLAHAFSPGTGIGGDAHFDEDEMWTDTSSGINLKQVATHEFGHSLGLGHTNISGSVMLPFYTFVPPDSFGLSKDDIEGIQSLYGAAVGTSQAPTQTSTQTPTQTSTQAPTQTSTQAPTQTSTQAPTQTSTQTPTQTSTQAPTQTSTQTPTQTSTQAPTQTSTKEPSTCDPDLFADAIFRIRRHIFLFKNGLYKVQGRPEVIPVNNTWPSMVSNVDAAVSYRIRRSQRRGRRHSSHRIIFFSGSQFWIFRRNNLVQGFPRPITDIGFPNSVTKIDAAMRIRREIFFFVGNQLWTYHRRRNELSGPSPISSTFSGISKVDAAFQYRSHYYLVSGSLIYKFRWTTLQSSWSGTSWMNCN